MLFKLALKNIRKSIKDYSIYFFTLIVGVIIFYIFNSLEAQNSMLLLNESKYRIVQSLVGILNYVSVFVSIILGFLIVYSNNFLIKRRKKEFGLYLTLGMSKRKVSMILLLETLMVGLLSLIVGLVLGIFLSQFLSIVTAKIFETNLTAYKFIFSSSALFKTIIYFGIIFILVMIFNVISLSRYKLIDLLTAGRKNEKVKIRNKYVITIAFIMAILLLVRAYSLLFDGVLFSMEDSKLIEMIVTGSLGTFMLFFSVSGFFLKIFQLIKKLYYKNLNLFVLKQINSKINTTVISNTVISLMLLLTIGILSGSISLTSVYNKDFDSNNKTDFTLSVFNITCMVNEEENCVLEEHDTNIDDVFALPTFKKYVKEYVKYYTYNDDNLVMNSLIDNKTKEKLKKEYGQTLEMNDAVPIIKESSYNEMMKLFKLPTIELDTDEYMLTANIDKAIEIYKNLYEQGNNISIYGHQLKPKAKDIVEVSYENFTGGSNYGTIVVDDSVIPVDEEGSGTIIGNYYNHDNTEHLEKEFENELMQPGSHYSYRTLFGMKNSAVGIKAIITFVGLYLGIIFSISSATVLAIGQLSEASDNKSRYKVLKQIGADSKMIKGALFVQIAVAFMIPLAVGLFHAIFGLKEVNKAIEMFGSIDLTSNIALTTVFIVIVYGGYFVVTYLCSKTLIKEN